MVGPAQLSHRRTVGWGARAQVSTRGVLAELLPSLGVPEERFASTCVLVDKLDKLPEEEACPADSAEMAPRFGAPREARARLALAQLGILKFSSIPD